MLAPLLICTTLIAQATTNVHPYEIKTEYDRVRNYTSCDLSFKDVIVDDDDELKAKLHIYATWTGQSRDKLENSDTISFLLTSSSESWEFLKFDNVSILYGKHHLNPEPKHDGDVHSGYVTESIVFKITYLQLTEMAKNDPIEFAVGNRSFSLKDSQITALKDLVSRLAVDSKEAEKIAADHLILKRKRSMELQEELDKAVEKARSVVKKMPRKLRAKKANEVGMKTMIEAFRPTALKYRPSQDEMKDLLQAYPEFRTTSQ